MMNTHNHTTAEVFDNPVTKKKIFEIYKIEPQDISYLECFESKTKPE